MVKINTHILLIVILVAVIASGCTGGKDITSTVKALPEVQQYMKEHPNATITVTYWSKEEVAKIEEEISHLCGKSITPVAMYKATIIDGYLKIVSWIDAENQILICSITEGKRTQEPTPSIPTPISTPAQVTVTDRVSNLGQPVKGKSNVWALTAGLDGNIYGGTGEGGTLFVYDPNISISRQIGEVFEEDAVYSLATDKNGLIYGGTAWNSKLFVYYPHNKSISYIGQPVANGGIICSLTVTGSNVYGSTCDGGETGYVGSHLFVYNTTARNFTDLGQPVEGERSSKIVTGKDGMIYGGTSPNGYLFSYDPGNKSFNNIGQPVHEDATAFPLIVGKNDKIYFSLDESLYVLDYVQSRIIKLFNLSDFIPLTGEFFWSLTAGLDGNIYGGTAPNGYLFVFNTSDNSIATGRPLQSEDRIRSLTTGLDGKIYGGTGWGAYLFSYNSSNKTSNVSIKTDIEYLKKDCIAATIRGIESEIVKHQKWIEMRKKGEVNDIDLLEIEDRLKRLKADLEKYQKMRIDLYELPEKIETKAWISANEPLGEDSILYIENMSKSGPWYHLVGIRGNNYNVIQPDTKYLMTIYLVYHRYYWTMPSYYVYIYEYKSR